VTLLERVNIIESNLYRAFMLDEWLTNTLVDETETRYVPFTVIKLQLKDCVVFSIIAKRHTCIRVLHDTYEMSVDLNTGHNKYCTIAFGLPEINASWVLCNEDDK